MKIEFVTDEEVQRLRPGGTSKYDFAAFVEVLYANPMQWGKFPILVPSHASSYKLRKFENIEYRVSGGNNLPVNHPDKKLWTIYARYVPPVTE